MKKILLLLILLAFIVGCASSPDEIETSNSQLIVTFKTKGKINIKDRDDRDLLRNYFIAVNCDNSDGSYGPLPVVYKASGSYGWGNGWGTSDKATQSKGITSFIEYNQDNPDGNLYLMIANSKLRQYTSPYTPVSFDITDDGKGIRAVFDYNQLSTSLSADEIKKLQINIITTNLIISNTTENTPGRRYDAIGTNGSDYIDIEANRNHTVKFTDDEGDVDDPSLDIVSGSIQIQYQK